MKTLYVCYFGLRQPLVQTQVLPYLRQLVLSGVAVDLLTFEDTPIVKWPSLEFREWQSRLEQDGIRWHQLSYHKRPSVAATCYDIVIGSLKAVHLVKARQIDVIHARSQVALAIALLSRQFADCLLVFDIRGLMAEEYADHGIWPHKGLRFRCVKVVERAGLKRADQIVVLTERMKSWLVKHCSVRSGKIEVIPCCVDVERFAASTKRLEPDRRSEVLYAGSTSGLYLLDEMVTFFLALRRRVPDVFFRILTNSPPDGVLSVLTRLQVPEGSFAVHAVATNEVPQYLGVARLGLSFRQPTLAQIAASPTKIPEYLAAGVPIVSNAGVGDTDDLLEKNDVGVIVRTFTAEAYAAAVDKVLKLWKDPNICDKCRSVAAANFDLVKVGGIRYANVYKRIEAQLGLVNSKAYQQRAQK